MKPRVGGGVEAKIALIRDEPCGDNTGGVSAGGMFGLSLQTNWFCVCTRQPVEFLLL